MELGGVKDMASAGIVCMEWTILEQEHKWSKRGEREECVVVGQWIERKVVTARERVLVQS